MSILGNSISTGSACHHGDLWTGTIKGTLWCAEEGGWVGEGWWGHTMP